MADDATLPPSIAAYFAATTPEAIAACFAEDGVAIDERRRHAGRKAILDWRHEVSKISFRQDVLRSRTDGGRIVVTCRVSGDFKGSPVDLDYAFRLSSGAIAELEIS